MYFDDTPLDPPIVYSELKSIEWLLEVKLCVNHALDRLCEEQPFLEVFVSIVPESTVILTRIYI